MQGLEVVKVHGKGIGGTGGGTNVHQLCDNVPHFDVWTGEEEGGTALEQTNKQTNSKSCTASVNSLIQEVTTFFQKSDNHSPNH